ncbi:MAG TPA: polyphosphate kinase 1 [Bacteroidia bacterium]|jgi:polyphosphate kinase|nr:polyphosphate kinase 1 [Bacteroidia bacterium]
MKTPYIPRDISWLAFNERVFQEATDKTVPLIERIKFLGIFSNNLDEFFRVRVATLNRLSEVKKNAKDFLGENPDKLLKQIHKIVVAQQKQVELIYESIVKELEAEKIFLLDETQLDEEHAEFVQKYFHEQVLPTLAPVMIDSAPKFPYLNDKAIYFAVKLFKKGAGTKGVKYAVLRIPSHVLPRFIVFPKMKTESRYIILLDNVIRFCLKEVFAIFDIDVAEAYTIKITRDAELELDNDLSKSILEKIEKSLKQRKKGNPVRMVYDGTIPKDLLDFITKKMKKGINLIPGGRYHNFRDFMHFPSVGHRDLLYHNPKPLPHPDLKDVRSLFAVIKKKDVLLSYPYQSFNHLIDLLREASIDPKVQSIKMTCYRLAENSNIIRILTNAIKNGKSVTVVVELQARFDEEANIFWANQLKEEGAEVIYGISGLKVHSKLLLITRKEGGDLVHYAQLGTGNFNENTAKLYSDLALLTADKRLTSEVVKVFNFFGNNFRIGAYKHLLVAPFFMRKKFVKYINREIKNAKAGKQAFITLKLNSLVDLELVKKLYIANNAGVKIKLIIRGSCSLVTGVKGLSENIEAVSIIDKYLEHSRVIIFCNGGDEKIYISSADWMHRNLNQRNEVAIPIYDSKIRAEIKTLIDIQFKDNTKARIIDSKQGNMYKFVAPKEKKVRSQDEIYNYIKSQEANS